MNPDFYMNQSQQKSIEQVIKYLIEQKKSDLVQPVLDLMRMSENWYGRLDEMRQQYPAPPIKPNQP